MTNQIKAEDMSLRDLNVRISSLVEIKLDCHEEYPIPDHPYTSADYVNDLNAIVPLITFYLGSKGYTYSATFKPSDPDYKSLGSFRVTTYANGKGYEQYGETLAIALCRLLVDVLNG